MKPKFMLPVALLTAVYSLGGLAPFQLASAKADEEPETEETSEVPTSELIPYACHDRAGNVVYTTIHPQETVGWALGCREVQYETINPESPPVVYFQCFDVNGALAFSTIDGEVAEDSGLFCREIGTRLSLPIPARPIYYECFNTNGTVAFTTSYPQETYGWKPGCREQQYQDAVATQPDDQPQASFECLDTNGDVAFTTSDPQEVRRWKLQCRQVQ
jgi:hypothetical protein